MYRIDRNNYFDKPKHTNIETPDNLSDFIFNILFSKIDKRGFIFDPCVGGGSLLKPWKKSGFKTFGIDIEKNKKWKLDLKTNYLEVKKEDINKIKPSLIIMNPPFNVGIETIEYIKQNKYGNARPFLPEVWLTKAVELFGKNLPIVMFTPYGFRLNLTSNSKRLQKFKNKEFPKITSIISLPKDIYGKEVCFHSEILIFNISNLEPHYFYF